MSQAKHITIEASGQIHASASGDFKSFHVDAYSGGPLRLKNFTLPVVINLKGLQPEAAIIANLDHDPNLRVGHVSEVINDFKTLKLGGKVSAKSASANEFVLSAERDFPWAASIEAEPVGKLHHVKAGEHIYINGQSFTGPLLIANQARLYGVAFLSHGADPTAKAVLAAAMNNQIGQGEQMQFEDWVKGMGFDPATLNESQLANLNKIYEAQAVQSETSPEVAAEAFNLDVIHATAERHRNEVEAALAQGEAELTAADLNGRRTEEFAGVVNRVRASATSNAATIKATAIREQWEPSRYQQELGKNVNSVRLEFMRAGRPQGPAIRASGANMRENGEVIEAAFCQSIELPNIEKHYSDQTLQAAHTAYRGQIGLQRVLIMAAAANGYDYSPGEKIHAGNLRRILAYALPAEGPNQIHAAGFSTLSLPGIFSNVANKSLLEGWMESDQAWREIATIKSVSDFKLATSYRMLDTLEYEELAPDGHIKHGELGEESYTRQIRTYAKMFALTRTDILNDDMDAFETLRKIIGAGAGRKFNSVFWTKFLANSSFFTSGRGNYITGSTTNLGTDGVGLEQGVTAFRKLRSPAKDGAKKIGGTPVTLLVPPELEFKAEKLYVGANTANVKVDEANPHANKYKPVVVDQLSDEDYPGYSTTAWYLFRTPKIAAPVAVSFLNGQQSPTVEQADADFDQLGVQFRGYHDFGVDFAEYLSGIKSKGAA